MKLESEYFDGVVWVPKIINQPKPAYRSTLGIKKKTEPEVLTNIKGNTAYFINTGTNQTKQVFVPPEKISKLRKDVAIWLLIHSKVRTGKAVLIKKTEYTKLSRDPLAPFDFQHISKREGIVTKVIASNRVVIDNKYAVTVPGIQPASKRDNPAQWEKQRQFTQSLVLNKKVYLLSLIHI